MAAGDGLVSMTPTSVVAAGTSSSATINTDGGVDYTNCHTLSLSGVFTSDFDNYLIVMTMDPVGADNAAVIYHRMRAAGSDNSTGSSYTWQRIYVTGTSVSGARTTGDIHQTFYIEGAANGMQHHVYGPALAQPTAFRTVVVSDVSSAAMYEHAGTHNQSTAYDGLTYFMNNPGTDGGRASGTVHVFGYEE